MNLRERLLQAAKNSLNEGTKKDGSYWAIVQDKYGMPMALMGDAGKGYTLTSDIAKADKFDNRELARMVLKDFIDNYTTGATRMGLTPKLIPVSEGVESTKDIIQDNIVPSFDDMGMAKVTPGEFAQEEITDQENLMNKASMSNDTDFNTESSSNITNTFAKASDTMSDLVDISAPDAAAIEITKMSTNCNNEDDSEQEDEDKDPLKAMFGESSFAKIVESVLGGKSCEEHLRLVENEWAGPKDFVPDTRINVSDVLRTLKNEIGDGSEGIHVDQLYDEQKNNVYKVSQIDKEKLPNKITVGHLILELDGDIYRQNKVSSEYPMQK